jgi:hypothetical protein
MPVQEDTNAAEHPAHLTPPRRGAHNGQSHSPATMKLLKRLGLTYVATEELTIRRLRHGRGFRYVAADGTPLRGEESQRLAALAVPPAYVDALYAADPSAHIGSTMARPIASICFCPPDSEPAAASHFNFSAGKNASTRSRWSLANPCEPVAISMFSRTVSLPKMPMFSGT